MYVMIGRFDHNLQKRNLPRLWAVAFLLLMVYISDPFYFYYDTLAKVEFILKFKSFPVLLLTYDFFLYFRAVSAYTKYKSNFIRTLSNNDSTLENKSTTMALMQKTFEKGL